MQNNIIVTDNAVQRILYLTSRGKSNKLRISVDGGGCSGFQYKYEFVDSINEDDLVITRDNVFVIIDEISKPYLEGSVIDYVEKLGSAYFEIKNPNATAKCGCGNSFTV